jgi:hypothetical protein
MSQLVKTKRQVNLEVLSDLEPLRSSSNKTTSYSTRSCVNWAFFGTRGPLKSSFHSRFKMAHACQKRSNLHTNSSNKLLLNCIPGHFFNIEHSPYLFPMFSFKKHRSMNVCNHVTKVTKIST